MGLNIPGYNLYCARGKEISRTCFLARNMNACVLPGFSCRDIVAILIMYIEEGAEFVCSAYLPFDSEDPPPSREMEKLLRYCENENLRLIVRSQCTP